MTVKILGGAELLRIGNYTDALELKRPLDTNVILILDPSEATLMCPYNLLDDFEMWPVEDFLYGWHMWENEDTPHGESLKYHHLIKDGGAWVYFGYSDQTHSTAVQLADEFIFRLEVYLHHAE